MMNLDLTGKKAIVCGSTQGIGKSIATELSMLGAEITLIARNEEALSQTAASLDTSAGQTHQFLVADFSKPEELRSLLNAYMQQHSCDILVNNTGGPPSGPITEAGTDAFISAYQAHLICNHILVQAVLPSMKSSGYGRIINVISTSVKQPLKGLGVSNTTRAAVAGWAKTLSFEVARFGITVNNVLPGATKTQRLESIISGKAAKTQVQADEVEQEMLNEIPAGRFGQPEEIAALAAFLASPAAGYINGQSIAVDGGRTMAF